MIRLVALVIIVGVICYFVADKFGDRFRSALKPEKTEEPQPAPPTAGVPTQALPTPAIPAPSVTNIPSATPAPGATPAPYELPQTFAWRELVTYEGERSTFQVAVIDGQRWRAETKVEGSTNTAVGIFDGTTFKSNIPNATAQMFNPRVNVEGLIRATNKTKWESMEVHGGQKWLRYAAHYKGKPVTLWTDAQTQFPIYLEGSVAPGKKLQVWFEVLDLKVAGNGSRYFDLTAQAPQFVHLLRRK